MEKSFSRPPRRYFNRQYRDPLGCTSKKRPAPSETLYGLGPGFELRTFASVSRSRDILGYLVGVNQMIPPKIPKICADVTGFGWTTSDRIRDQVLHFPRENGHVWTISDCNLAEGEGLQKTPLNKGLRCLPGPKWGIDAKSEFKISSNRHRVLLARRVRL
jgi:hypothetical protein